MNLEAHLENLRSKPDHIKHRYAFWSAFGITAVIFLFWLASFTSLGANSRDTVANAVDRAGTPVGSMVASVGSFFGDIKDMIFGPKKVTYSSVIATPGDR
ncbi:MAG: hypothetical protein NTZ38_00970 [Candidatus Taylorbacteria bacterium]|nr:hypothetical protein [Candidatus Taylorbacteria bacterium]